MRFKFRIFMSVLLIIVGINLLNEDIAVYLFAKFGQGVDRINSERKIAIFKRELKNLWAEIDSREAQHENIGMLAAQARNYIQEIDRIRTEVGKSGSTMHEMEKNLFQKYVKKLLRGTDGKNS